MTDEQRYVFDTGVLVSAAVFPQSTPREALRLGFRNGVLLLSSATASELHQVLSRTKFDQYIRLGTRMRFMAALLRRATVVMVDQPVQACRDSRDDKFLELALAGRATYLITGDRDLLTLHPFRSIPILTPAQFLATATSPPDS
jgi:uncharacterized protein